jgi:hypothetical protein
MTDETMRILLTTLMLSWTATTGFATPYCDKYRFGSQEWWNCEQSQRDGGR